MLFNRKNNSNPSEKAEMSFIEHLDVLRSHLFKSVVATTIGAIVVAIFNNFIVQRILLGPTRGDFPTYSLLCRASNYLKLGSSLCMKEIKLEMQSNTVSGQFDVYLNVIVIGGFVIAFPYIFWQFWKFAKPALTQKELKNSRGVIFWVSTLFFIGILFGYFVISPYTINFFANFSLDEKIKNIWTINSYFNTILPLTLGSGLAFQLPLVLYFLAKVGVVSATALKKFRRYAYLTIIVVAGFITPPDMLSQIICSVPIILLYEISIIICRKVEIKENNKAAQEWE
ncbi:MAG: twin-arginine translocase subunit TatC [Bacteroidetes bacterium]|nr:twin-arginine translocase subunit TatC [Bacteroidota bacterium]MBS1648876.1 twin-arginine translocase subunit TatC [Bacteroidota bacterium]